MNRRGFLGASLGAVAARPAEPAPIYGPEHLDEHGEFFIRLAVYPAGCPRPAGVEVEELDTPGWAAGVERTRINPSYARYAAVEGTATDPHDPALGSPAYRLPSGRDALDDGEWSAD